MQEDPASSCRRLALGTAQFGMQYGIANKHGQPQRVDVAAILQSAHSVGITTLDTAAAYGNSEDVLGQVGVQDWQIITKVPSLAKFGTAAPQKVLAFVRASLKKLGVPHVHAIMLHDINDLLGPQGPAIADALHSLQDQGLTTKIGVSVYDVQILEGLKTTFMPQIIQVPFNPLDQRVLAKERLDTLHTAGVEIHARSLFLQGLLLMPAQERSAYFTPWSGALGAFDQAVKDSGQSALAFCLGFAKRHAGIKRLLIGVDTQAQLEQIAQAYVHAPHIEASEVASQDTHLIEPVHWEGT